MRKSYFIIDYKHEYCNSDLLHDIYEKIVWSVMSDESMFACMDYMTIEQIFHVINVLNSFIHL